MVDADQMRSARHATAVLVVAVATAGTVALWSWADLGTHWWQATALAVAFAAAERWVVPVRPADRSYGPALGVAPLLFGLFLVPPTVLVAARVVGAGTSQLLAPEEHPHGVAFDVAHRWVEALAAVAVVTAIAPEGPLDGARATLTAVLVAAVVTVVGSLAATTAAAAGGARRRAHALRTRIGRAVGPVTATTALTMTALAALTTSPWLVWAPVAAAGAMAVAYRSHTRLVHLHDRQSFLLEYTREATEPQAEDAVLAGVEQATAALRGVVTAAVAVVDPDGGIRWPDSHDVDQVLHRAVVQHLARETDDGATAVGRPVRTWSLDDHRVLAVEVDPRTPAADDLVMTLDQIVRYAAVALANAVHAQALEAQVRDAARRALVDPLTALPNRTALLEGIDRALDAGRPFATLLMDLDDFKEINDALGHAAGDQVLVEVSRRLLAVGPEAPTADGPDGALLLARLGGDEFAVLVEGGETTAREYADRLLAVVRRPVEVHPYRLQVSGSIGIAVHPDHGTDGDTLLKHADLAMYTAKGSSADVAVFGRSAAGEAVRHLAISTSFRAAVQERAITAHYQPQVDLATGALLGVEALARWTHPALGVIRPDEFIKVAEQAGMLPELTTLMVADALAWQQRWAADGLDIGVAVNLSARSLLDTELPRRIAAVLDVEGVAADRLTLEITESNVISDPQRTLAVLGRLSRLGVRLSIDDFGTGYSSLAYLQELPADEVKVDKSFVLPMSRDEAATPLVGGIIRLCHELGFAVVAEGIENAAVQSVLRRMGCDAGQGFHIARAMPPDQLRGWAEGYARARGSASMGGAA